MTTEEPADKPTERLTPAEVAARRRKRNTRRIAVIAGTAALTTAVSGIVGGIVSPDRVQSVLGLSDDPSETASESPSESPTPSATQPALEFKRVTDSAKAIAVDIPSGWRVVDDGFTGIEGIASPGLALRAGPDPARFRIQSDETAYVGASTGALEDLGLAGLDDAAVAAALERRRQAATYLSQYGCVPTNEHTPRLGDEWVGASQAWQDCFAVEGWRAVEIEMVSTDRDVYVFIQIGLPAATPDDVSQRIVDSLTVLPPALPTSG